MRGRKRWLALIAAAGLAGPTIVQAEPLTKGTIGKAALGEAVIGDGVDARAAAFAHLQAGDRPAALADFEQAARETPEDAFIWRMVGDLRFALDQPEAALRAWRTGLAKAPSDLALLRRVAQGAVAVGDYALAAEVAGQLAERFAARLELGPDQATSDGVRTFLGAQSELATLAGDFTTAEEAARRLIKLSPQDPAGHLALAYMYLQAHELDEAEAIYADVLSVDADNTVALNNLGNILYMRRDLDGAAEQFEAVLEAEGVAPRSQSLALANLAELLQLQEAFSGAEELYEQALELQPEAAWGYMGLAALYDVTGRYDEAVDVMINGWERDQNRLTRLNMHFFQPEWYWQRDALIAEIEGRPADAEALWSQVLRGEVEMLHKAAAWHLEALREDG